MSRKRRKAEPVPPNESLPAASSAPPDDVPKPGTGNDDVDDQADGSDGNDLGEAIVGRDRAPLAEALALDALDDAVDLSEPSDDLALDATDEIAALPAPEDYVTTDSGDRKPRRDDAEMGFGAEPRSIDELADSAIGDAIPGRRGTRREGEAHGEDLGLR